LRSLRDPDRFDAWLSKLTVNASIDLIRRRRSRPIEVEITPLHSPAVADPAASVADRDAVDRVMQALDPAGRAVIVLHYYRGLRMPDVAGALGIPTGTAKPRLHRALAQMRDAAPAGSGVQASIEGRPA